MAAVPPLFASGAAPSPAALRAAQARLMRDPNLQFSFPVASTPPQGHAPGWLVALIRWLGEVLAWLGKGLGWVFLVGLAVAAAMVIFFVVRELIRTRWPQLFARKARPAPPAETWRPAPAAARALLAEADRLAAAGAYAEAARLILRRSIEEIDGRRPRLVAGAMTAREIARLAELPEAARTTFAAIAAVVERSLFAGRSLDAAGFAECRRTYEAFALPGAWT